jgi:alpha-D-ribose 1-methylphosphonate 5-triphosphate diphosphatase PhnM
MSNSVIERIKIAQSVAGDVLNSEDLSTLEQVMSTLAQRYSLEGSPTTLAAAKTASLEATGAIPGSQEIVDRWSHFVGKVLSSGSDGANMNECFQAFLEFKNIIDS